MITKRVSRCRAIVRVRVECCRETMLSTSSLVERARDLDAFHEMPNKEKIVLPLILFDAVPVGADDFSQCNLPLRSNKHCSASMISLLPVPPGPPTNMRSCGGREGSAVSMQCNSAVK